MQTGASAGFSRSIRAILSRKAHKFSTDSPFYVLSMFRYPTKVVVESSADRRQR
jgi:hypothetical protein